MKEDHFKEALKLYESKQYKKSLKVIDAALKKNKSADLQALKGLVLSHLNQPEEAKLYVGKAQANNLSNPMANHILALYYRNILDFKNAAKWYSAAIENGSANVGIYRDLSTMYSQTREFKKLVAPRLKYLESQPMYRANWTGVAVAHYLNGDYAACEKVLTRFEKLADGKLSQDDSFENSECILFKNEAIAKLSLEKALEHLDSTENDVIDKTAVLELRAKYLIQLDRKKEASLVARQLLMRNPDNIHYYTLLELALNTNQMSVAVRLALYDKLAEIYPSSDIVHYLPLTFAKGPEFRVRVEKYISMQVKRGVPSAFNNVKPLYKDHEKAEIIAEVVAAKLLGACEEPLSRCWTLAFLARHFLHLQKVDTALEYVEKAIELTPTLPELYLLKARVLKHAKRLADAAESADFGRQLDLQDRFLNSKASKYRLRADQTDEAIRLISMFTKGDEKEGFVNGLKDIHLVQCMWFIIESGESYLRQKMDGLALKRLKSLAAIYTEFENDQLDFHSYCMRKGTPRAYFSMMAWAENLYKQPVYSRIVEGIGAVYMGHSHDVAQVENKKQKHSQAKAKNEMAQRLKIESEEKDHDPLGEKELNRVRNLSEKARLDEFFTNLYSSCNQDEIRSIICGAQLFILQQKHLLALQKVNKLSQRTNQTHPATAVLLLALVAGVKADDKTPLKKAVEMALAKQMPDLDQSTLADMALLKKYVSEKFLRPPFSTAEVKQFNDVKAHFGDLFSKFQVEVESI